MDVPFYNFQKIHPPEFRKDIVERFSRIIEQGSFIEGEFNTKLEHDFAQLCSAKYCALVANGTDALEIALLAEGISPGMKVGVPGITFHATAEAVLNVGATPVLIDTQEDTGLICSKSLKRVLAKCYLDAIIPVHIYGLPAPLMELEEICRPRQIKIIEDCAQAHGGCYEDGTAIGSRGHLATFSFYPTKNLGAFGDAGAIVCQSEEQYKTICRIRNHGRGDQELQIFGRNSRCDHLQAAVIHLKLQNFASQLQQRRRVAETYLNCLSDLKVITQQPEYLPLSSWHLFPILLAHETQRNNAQNYLREKGIASVTFYGRALSEEAPMQNVMGEGQRAEAFSKKVLCLPMHPFLEEGDIVKIATCLREFLDGK